MIPRHTLDDLTWTLWKIK